MAVERESEGERAYLVMCAHLVCKVGLIVKLPLFAVLTPRFHQELCLKHAELVNGPRAAAQLVGGAGGRSTSTPSVCVQDSELLSVSLVLASLPFFLFCHIHTSSFFFFIYHLHLVSSCPPRPPLPPPPPWSSSPQPAGASAVIKMEHALGARHATLPVLQR